MIFFLTAVIGITIIATILSGVLLWAVSKYTSLGTIRFSKSILFAFLLGILSGVQYLFIGKPYLGILSGIIIAIAGYALLFTLVQEGPNKSRRNTLLLYLAFLFLSSIISPIFIIGVRTWVATPFVISGESMEPTYNRGDYVIVNKLKKYERGDVVVYRSPEDPSRFYISRIVGLPGEMIELQDGAVFIDQTLLDEPYVSTTSTTTLSTMIPQDSYFLLADKRDISRDSKQFGPIQEDTLAGAVIDTAENKLFLDLVNLRHNYKNRSGN